MRVKGGKREREQGKGRSFSLELFRERAWKAKSPREQKAPLWTIKSLKSKKEYGFLGGIKPLKRS